MEPRCRIYFNLHKKCFSVQVRSATSRRWVVCGRHYSSFIIHEGIGSKVYETGRQRVIREKRKNVHAYLLGHTWTQYTQEITPGPIDYMVEHPHYHRVSYNPYRDSHFMVGEHRVRLNDALLSLKGPRHLIGDTVEGKPHIFLYSSSFGL